MSMKKPVQHILFACAVVFVMSVNGRVQTQNQQNTPTAAPFQAIPNDVDSVEHIVRAAYDSISGPAGPRNWERLRSLFYAGARLVPSHRDDKGAVVANSLTLEEYIGRAKPYFEKEGFYESSVVNRVEAWDH